MNSFTATTVFWILATYFFSVALCDDDIPISEPGSLPRVTLTPARVTVPSSSSDVTLTASADPAPADGETIVVSYSVLVYDVETIYTVEFTTGQTETDVVISIPSASPEGTVIDVALENDPSGSMYTVGGRNASQITVSDSVDGGWSSWVDPDPSLCELCTDKLESTRTCTDPAPSGGGAPCEGESTRPYYCFDVQYFSGCSFEVYVKMILAPGLPENVAIDAVKTRFEEPTRPILFELHQKAAVQQTATNSFSFLINPNDKGCDSSCIYWGLLGFDRNPILHGIGEVLYINIFPEDTIPPICFNEERLVWRFYDPSVVSYTSSGASTNECSDGTLSAAGVRAGPFMMYGPGYNAIVPIIKPIPSFNLSLYLQTYEEDGLVLISSAFVSLLGAEVVLQGNDLFVIPAENQFNDRIFPFGRSKQHVQSKAQVEGELGFGFGFPFGEPLASFFPITAGEWIYFEVAVVEGEIRIKVGEEEFIPLTDFPAIGELSIREGPVEGIEFEGPFFPPGFSHHRFELLSLGITGNVSGVIINTICQVDGWLAPGEECDDGNSVDDDGCSNSCKIVQEELCVCEEGKYTEIHLDRPSWMNEEPPSLAEDATKIFNVDCPNNAECCFTIQRPYVKGGVWSIGGFSMEAGRDVLPFELPPESTDFQTDTYNGWESNNVEGKQGACFERIKVNAPGSQWTTRTEGCDLIQTYCFNPIAEILPFQCRNETTTSDNTGLPLFKVTCDIYLDLLRPKHNDQVSLGYGWPTPEFLKWGNRLHTTIAIDLGVVVTSTLDYVTPYINTQVDEMGYLIGNVELDFGGTQWTAFKITESKLGSWESELNGDGTNSTGDVQKDANDNALGYELTLRNNHNVAIKSNSVRSIYVDTIYLRLELEDNTGASTNVTLKVEIKARNIVVDKSQNPIGLNIQPVVKILQRDPTAPRDLNTAVVPSYPVLSIEDLFVMEVPRTDNDNLRLSSITATLHRTNPINGELIRPPVAVLIDDNTPIASPLWEFQLADASYIQSKELSTAYSFRLAVEAGSYAIEQTLIFEVYYGEGGPAHQKMKVQQVTKPASLQTTTQLTVSVGFNGEEILQIETDVNTIDSNNNNEENGNGNSETTPNVVVIDTQKPQNVNVGGNTDSQSSPLVTGIIAGSIGAVVVVVIIALVILVILKFKQQDNDMENRPLTPRTKQQQMDMNL